ncbi:MAG: phosphoglycerate kinase [Candidatus Ratteibacteria bacterium]
MDLATIEEREYAGKKVFVRVDFNVPLDKNLAITDDTRIVAVIPTIEYLLKKGASLILASHLGRPQGAPSKEFSLKPVALRLAELLRRPVTFADDCIGTEVKKRAEQLKSGDILLLENLRFHPEEEKNDKEFSRSLASLADAYVNDAFGTSHRAHASITGVPFFLIDKAAGFLIKKEVEALSRIQNNPERPLLVIVGGSKASDKIAVLKKLISKIDTVLTGGVVAYTFVKAKNWAVGNSKVDEAAIPNAKEIIRITYKLHNEFHTPLDHLITNKVAEDGDAIFTDRGTVPKGWTGVDIGPQAIEEYRDCISRAKTIFWNGPMGIFEIPKFSKGTIAIAKAVAESNAYTVVGGGDSIAAVHMANVADKISHICTGGGASLEFLEKNSLPGIDVLTLKDTTS